MHPARGWHYVSRGSDFLKTFRLSMYAEMCLYCYPPALYLARFIENV